MLLRRTRRECGEEECAKEEWHEGVELEALPPCKLGSGDDQ